MKIDKCPVCGKSGFLAKRWASGKSKIKYFHYYVGHYDKEKYATTLMAKNKRTNGRRWCYITNDNKILSVLEKRKK